MINTDELKHLATGHWRDILANVAGIPWEHLDGNGHTCPKCEGTDRFSLSYPAKGGCFCRRCFHKDNGDGIAAVMWALDIDFQEAIKRIAEHLKMSDHTEPAAPVGTVTPLADPVTLHNTYSAILAKMTLSAAHRAALQARGLTDEAIEENQYRTHHPLLPVQLPTSPPGVPGVENGKLRASAGILIPVRNQAGQIVRLRVRLDKALESGTKYLYASSAKRGGASATAHAHVPLGTPGTADVVRLTEGEFKSELAWKKTGIPTLSFPGATSWKTTKQLVKQILKRSTSKTVLLAFDTDKATNDQVAQAEREACEYFQSIGYTVKIESWDSAYKGIDEALMAGVEIIATEAAAQPASSDADLTDEQRSILEPQNRTDDANAERFVQEHKHRLRFLAAKEKDGGRWLACKKGLWIPDDGFTHARQAAKRTGQKFWREITPFLNKVDPAKKRELIHWANHGQSIAGQKAMLESAKSHPEMVLFEEQLNQNIDHILPVRNGVVELVTDPEKGTECGRFRPHNPDDYTTKVAPVTYDPAATCPRFDRFLKEIAYDWKFFTTCRCDEDHDCGCSPLGKDDKPAKALWEHLQMPEYILRLLGYMITSETREQSIYLLYGPGANGKTTLIETVGLCILGDHFYCALSENFLLQTKHPTNKDLEKRTLRGKRLASAAEVNDGSKLNEALVKQLSGGDTVRGRGHYLDFEDFAPTHKLVLVCNDLPVISGTDKGMWRRIKIIPFVAQIPESKKDKDLLSKLRKERSGILNAILKGLKNYRQFGDMEEPPNVTKASEKYREESDFLQKFITECCDLDSAAISEFNPIFNAFRDWYRNEFGVDGQDAMSATAFGKALSKKGFQRAEKKRGKPRMGLRLKPGFGSL